MKYVVGIDEAGRGPLAGPVAVGVVLDQRLKTKDQKFLEEYFPKLKDSKKLSEKRREEYFEVLQKLKKEGIIDFAVALVPASIIDNKGIVYAIQKGIEGCLAKFDIDPALGIVLLDGGLKAPSQFISQETIIKGDESEPIISLASIVAKVTRDRKMVELAKEYPEYGFEVHKGYGTAMHCKIIREKGVCEIHRVSFCKNID